MSPFIPLTDTVFVAPQITLDDVKEAANLGIKTVISNRPDGESTGQPTADEVAKAASDAGMVFHHVPAISGQFTPEAIEGMATALAGAEPPVLAFCRSGTRSTILWALVEAARSDGLSVEDIVATAGRAGYDLAPLAPTLEARRVGT